MQTLSGGCQCGNIRYEIRNADDSAYFCHCRMCQKAFGNIFAALKMVGKEDVVWLKETPTYFHSSKLAQRGFCEKCGTPLTFEYHHKNKMDISVGSLDEPGFLKPTSHSGVESRIESFAWKDDLNEYRTEENEDYINRWKAAYGADSMPGPQV